MKDKLEPNMYVRTKEGKIFNCFASESMGKPVYYIKDSLTNGFIDYNEAYKVSPNIIDIVQVRDYVNGSKVIDISIIGKDKEKWVWIEQMEDTDNKYDDDYVGYNNEQIKSIVTKEQFEQMAYKVGD